MRIPIPFAALMLAGAALGAPLAAQESQSGARVLPWVGCWEAVDGIASPGRLCVIPEREHGLRLVSFDAEGKMTESTLQLDGERADVNSGGCTGWEQARLSADGDRVLIDAQIQCADAPQQKRTTAFLITPSGHWLQVNGSGVQAVATAQVRLYRAVTSYAAFPSEIRAAAAPYAAEAEKARLGAMERSVSAKDLLELEAMGVATPVLDLVVAASYPESFVIDAQGAVSDVASGLEGQAGNRPSMSRSPFYFSNGFPMLSYYDMAMLQDCVRMGGLACSFGTSLYGYQRYAGYGGYGGYGYGGFGGYWPGYGLPVVVRPTQQPTTGGGGSAVRGRAVRGQGYTSGSTETPTRIAEPRSGNAATARTSGSSGSSSSSGSSGSSSSSGSSGSSGAAPRTAQPRSP